ncbi:hypothetical protein ACIP5Y_36490 [Nocardia sp. NPDC088792]|uniref:hypothetical protein n=1 Tax=Nocardia sp. NPDC088792 TaxID=3364332 RepID=UPI0037F9F721
MYKIATTGALMATALTLAAAPAGAAPESGPAAVNFTTHTSATATTIATDSGAMAADNGLFTIKAPDGTVLAGTELSFRVDDFVFPIAADIAGRTATLTPEFDREHAVYRPIAQPSDDQALAKSAADREQAAWNRMAVTMQMGGTIGTAVGAIGGAAVGCVLGGIAGAAVASAAIIGLFGGFLPAAALGCIGGMLALGSLGTIAGSLLISAPIAIAAAVQYFLTINAPAK